MPKVLDTEIIWCTTGRDFAEIAWNNKHCGPICFWPEPADRHKGLANVCSEPYSCFVELSECELKVMEFPAGGVRDA